MTVVNLVLLSVQAWTGDVVNLFGAFPSGQVKGFGGALQALESSGPGPLGAYHAAEGVLILLLCIGIAVAAIRKSRSRGVKVASVLALLAVAAAALGGYLFLFSGFANDGNSAQMGGAFIGAYAMNFLVLYYSK